MFEKNSIGLCRDDRLSTFRNYNGHQSDKVRKDLTELFKKYQLNLDIKCNLKTVDYLDKSFDLNTGIYKPFSKPNNKPLYINASSNHPPPVLKQIPKSASKRITANSCNEDIFRKSVPFYNSILHDCGFNENIKYCPEESVSSRRRKNRSRNIIWYNRPFSRNIKTNVAKHFFKLLNKHFRKNHEYEIFNKINIKVSYSCVDNMKKVINSHNKYVASKKDQVNQNPNTCPLDNKCLTSKIVYSVEIITDDQQLSKFYLGICGTECKTRFNNHKKSFRHRENEKDTELSKYIWELKDKQTYRISD